MRILSAETVNKVGEEVVLKGWVHSRRDMGKVVFFDLRDMSGLIQIVCVPSELGEAANENVKKTRSEFVLEIHGVVQARGAKQINEKLVTGKVEILAKDVIVLNEAKTAPFELDKSTAGINEEVRLKYRYLDLRTERMANNIRMRSEVDMFLRNFFCANGFVEVETPCLTKGTPEGAREYLVPSRLYPGEFYVLPQSPQQFKQLLMVAGYERYFQIARCFRDEDQRGDRQPEFTQFDLEMSFVTQDDVMSLVEKSVTQLVQEKYPHLKIQSTPFPRMTYAEAMEKYNSDKPDIRENKEDATEMAFLWVVDFPLLEYSETDKKWNACHHPFTRPQDEDLALLDSAPEKVRAYAYDLVLNGFEVGGGSIRIHERDLQKKVFEVLGIGEEEQQMKFAHMLEAFEYGAPPHGGLALGLDRLIALLQGEKNIREVIAFPKTGDAKDLLMSAPSPMPEKSLKEANIKIA